MTRGQDFPAFEHQDNKPTEINFCFPLLTPEKDTKSCLNTNFR